MTAAQFEMLEATEAEELLRARFESLTWHGCPPGNALVIASHLDIELLDAIVLLQRGCPAHLVHPSPRLSDDRARRRTERLDIPAATGERTT